MRTFAVIIEHSHDLTLPQLFHHSLSFRMCIEKARWPSLETANAFLRNGIDDGIGGSTLRWEPGEDDDKGYRSAIASVMDGNPFTIDDDSPGWADWFESLAIDQDEPQ